MNKYSVLEYSRDLKNAGLLPQNIQFSRWHNWHLVSAFDQEDNHFITENTSMGIDPDYETALFKALTEYCERRLLGQIHHPGVLLSKKSDGMAAFPAKNEQAKTRARYNAYHEALERFLWATWWDNPDILAIKHDASVFPDKNLLISEFNLTDLFSVEIRAARSPAYLLILFAKTAQNGFITGGACGDSSDNTSVYYRAFGELLRHLVVVEKMAKNEAYKPQSFYEERLWGFGSGAFGEIAETRLAMNGHKLIELPELIFDGEIPHEHSDLVTLHRCYFKNQPEFVGGDLRRLCL